MSVTLETKHFSKISRREKKHMSERRPLAFAFFREEIPYFNEKCVEDYMDDAVYRASLPRTSIVKEHRANLYFIAMGVTFGFMGYVMSPIGGIAIMVIGLVLGLIGRKELVEKDEPGNWDAHWTRCSLHEYNPMRVPTEGIDLANRIRAACPGAKIDVVFFEDDPLLYAYREKGGHELEGFYFFHWDEKGFQPIEK